MSIPSCSLQSQVKEKEESVVSLQERLAKSDAKALAAEGEVSKVCYKEMCMYLLLCGLATASPLTPPPSL